MKFSPVFTITFLVSHQLATASAFITTNTVKTETAPLRPPAVAFRRVHQKSPSPMTHSIMSSTCLYMSDFGTAMPPKPEQSVDERIRMSAHEFAQSMQSNLELNSHDIPAELVALQEAVDTNASLELITMRTFELLIEEGMCYEKDPETGVLTPIDIDIPSSLDVPEVKAEFAYLYKYGMSLIGRGLVSEDNVKSVVLERLIARTGLSPSEFDSWLGY
jgi:hypothetical protein